MEQGKGSQSGHRNPISNSVVSPVQQQQQQQRSYASPDNTREQDYYVPGANVTRIMRRVLPPHAKIADDAKEAVQQCVTEYINMVTSEANDRCRREERKTVTANDILWAFNKLGFDNYVGPLSLFLDRYRDARMGNARREWSEERGESLGRRVADSRQLPPPTFSSLSADAMGGINLGYSMDNAGAGSSSSYSTIQGGAPSFGPYAQFSSLSADAMGGMNLGYSMDNAGAGSSSSYSTSQGGAPSFGPYAQFKR